MVDIDFFEGAAAESCGGLSVAVADEEHELTEVEVEEKLDRLRAIKDYVASLQMRRDAFQAHYREKIAKAEEQYETDSRCARAEIDALMGELRRYAVAHITGKAKHLKFPSGKLCLTKQSPIFFIGGVAVTNDNPKLIEIARNLDPALVKTKEVADWGKLKSRLKIDDDGVVLVEDTGEVVPDMRAKIEPDKFDVKPA